MSTLTFMTRVRAFFGGKHTDVPDAIVPEGVWPAGGRTLALVGASVAQDASTGNTGSGLPRQAYVPSSPTPKSPREPAAAPGGNGNGKRPRIDPIDPAWITQIDSLEDVGRELQHTHETGQALLESVRQLPELTADQNDRIAQTNRLLQRQNTLLGCVCDGVGALRASMQTMDESARRHLLAINQLESAHRHVLLGYQKMLLDSHRRVGRLAALATVVASLGMAGAAYVTYLVLSAG